MQLDAPTWHLKTACPVCGQGSMLCLLACEDCGCVNAECEEEGTWFEVSFAGVLSVRASNFNHCASCGSSKVHTASLAEVRAAGIGSDLFF